LVYYYFNALRCKDSRRQLPKCIVVQELCADCRVKMSVSVVAKNTCQTTGEGPYWEEASSSLVYVDITQGDVHRWSSVTNEDTSLHLSWIYFICHWS